MPSKRKRSRAEFKSRVALAAVKGGKTGQQLGKDFQVHPSPITIWKQQLTGQVAELLKRKGRGVVAVGDEALRQAYGKIGRLDNKLDWLKKLGPLH